MRRAVAQRILQSQHVCFFCAFQRVFAPQSVAVSLTRQRRLYRSSASLPRPAGAAAARVQDDDDYSESIASDTRELLGWRCRCSHVNQSRRTECTLCASSRPAKAELVYKSSHPPTSRAPSQRPPNQSPSPPTPFQTPVDTSQRIGSAIGSRNNVSEIMSRVQSPSGPHAQRQGWQGTRQPRVLPETTSDRYSQARNGRKQFRGEDTVQSSRFPPGTMARPDRPRYGGQQATQGSGWRNWNPSQATADPPGSQNPFGDAARLSTNFPAGQRRTRSEFEERSWKQTGSQQRLRFPRSTDDGDSANSTLHDRRSTPRENQEMQASESRSFMPFGTGASQRSSADRRGTSRTVDLASTTTTTNVLDAGLDVDDEPAEEPSHRQDSKFGHNRPDSQSRRARLYEDDGEAVVSEQEKTPGRNRRKNRPARNETIDFDLEQAELELYGDRRKKNKGKKGSQLAEQAKPEIHIPEFVAVDSLARMLKVRVDDFIAKLEEEGYEGARYDHILDSGTSAMFADLYGFEPIIDTIVGGTEDLVARPPPEDPSVLPPRPPIVTIMGHVDHGKTTILDYLRKSSVVASEHGGITQHIGAFSVVMPGSERNITFLDTPGHAAFLDMRRRGAIVTDIVVLVVAADDSVKPQTIEAIKHARESNVEIIVAINKVDKEEADPDRVKRDLLGYDVAVEDFDGPYQAVALSGKTGQGMADLEEAILTLADVADYRAEVDGPVEGWILESTVTSAGRVATVLVRRGTLRTGDFIVAGTTWARVRSLRDDAGQVISEAPPGTPVQVDGWRGHDPTAGLEVIQADTEERAKEVIELRKDREESLRASTDMSAINETRAEEAEARAKVLAWEREQGFVGKRTKRIRSKEGEGWIEKEQSGPQQVHFVVKADVAGSVEALVAAVSSIGNHQVVANVIHSGTGVLTESDIKHLAATGEVGYAISFNQPVDASIRQLAAAADLSILDHNIIYKVTDDVKEKLTAELPPIIKQRVLGEAEIGQMFEIKTKRGKIKIAGCRIHNGLISRTHKVRVLRNDETVYTGTLDSLKHVKKDVTEMRKGTECGMGFDGWEDFQEGDQVQTFEEIKELQTLY